MIDFNSQAPDASSYTRLKDGTLLNEKELQDKISSGEIEQRIVDENEGLLSRRAGIGARGLLSAGAGVAGIIGDAVGSDSLKNWGLQEAQRQENISQLYSRPEDKVENVDWTSPSQIGRFALGAIAEQTPNLVGGLLTGGAGAIAGVGAKQLAQTAVKAEVNNLVRNEIAKKGFQAGMFAFNAGQSAGSIYPNAIKNNVENPVLNSVAGGILAGGIDTVTDMALINAIAKPGVGGASMVKNILGQGVKGGLREGSTEVAQTGIERGFGGQAVTGDEANSDYLNSFAQAFFGGGAAGAIGGARSARSDANVNNNINPVVDNNVNPSVEVNTDNTVNVAPAVESTPAVNTIDIKERDISDNNLSNSERFQSLVTERPELSNITEFNPDTLKEAGLSDREINNVRQDLKTVDFMNTEIDGYRLSDLINKDISSLPSEEVDSLKEKIKTEAKKYKDSSLYNYKLAVDTNKAIDSNYTNSVFDEEPREPISKVQAPSVQTNEVVATESNSDVVAAQSAAPNVSQVEPIKETPLSTQERMQVSKVKSNADNLFKGTNVNAEVQLSKNSQYKDKNASAYYDSTNDKLVIFADKINDDNDFKSIINHELLHRGVYKMVKGLDKTSYQRELDNLYKNPNLASMADQLQTTYNYDRYTAIEESLARMAETGDMQKLGGIDKFFNTLKNIVNKMVGNDTVNDDNVRDYVGRAVEFNFTPANVAQVQKTAQVQTTDYVNDMGNMPRDVMFSEKYTEKEKGDLEKKLKEIYKNTQGNIDLKNSTDTKNFFGKIGQSVNNNIDVIKNKSNTSDAIGKLSKALSSVRELSNKFDSTQILQNIFDASRTQEGGLNQRLSGKLNDLKKIRDTVKDAEDKEVNKMITDYALQENNGMGRRPVESEVRSKIANNDKIKNKEGAYNLYNARRELADYYVNMSTLSDKINLVNFAERAAKLDVNSDLSIITDFRNAINQVQENADFKTFNDTMKNLIARDNPLNLNLSDAFAQDINSKFKTYMDEMSDVLSKEEILINQNGFLPKDHSGKYINRIEFKYMDENGKEQKVILGVHASDSFVKRNMYKQAFQKMIDDMQTAGLIKSAKDFNVVSEDRNTETISNLDPQDFINKAERQGVELTDEQKQAFSKFNESYKLMERVFKTGVGYSLDIDKVLTTQISKANQKVARNMYYNQEIDAIKDTRGPEKDLIIEMQNQRNAANDSDALSSKLRGYGSLFFLGFNLSSAGMQVFQYMQASPSWFYQFTDSLAGTGALLTNSGKKASAYLMKGKTGDVNLDNAIKAFTNDLLSAQSAEMLFNVRKGEEFKRSSLSQKVNQGAFYLFGKAEELNRLTTFIASYEIHNNQGKYPSRTAIDPDFNKFVINNLVKVNGDYSAYNRPQAFRGPVAQTLFMFKQFLVFAAEMFKHMDGKSKAAFIATIALTSGINGLPFSEDGQELIDFLMKMFGIPFSLKRQINKTFNEMGNSMGIDNFESYAKYGLFPSLGTRASYGQVVPFMGGITEIAGGGDVGQGLQNIQGPTAALVVSSAKGLGSLLRGDVTQAFREAAPSAVKNVVKSGQQFMTGNNLNASGTAVTSKADWFDATLQLMGYSSVDFISTQKNQDIINDAKQLKKSIQKDFRQDYIKAKIAGRSDEAREIVNNAREFNRMAREAGSGYDFNINVADWNKQARLGQLGSNDRSIKTSDKALRRSLSQELE